MSATARHLEQVAVSFTEEQIHRISIEGVSSPVQSEPQSIPATYVGNDPYGCPVRPSYGQVIVTQGYGVGSHAPAATWGAIDLAVGTQGYATPNDSQGQPIVATHQGVARVTMGSWPGGNHVWIDGGTWRTGYAHLQDVIVRTGEEVMPGQQIGTLGSTGMSSGPHLDYQVWRHGTNVDPTPFVASCFP